MLLWSFQLFLPPALFFAANEAFRVGCEISVFRKDAFHGAAALSRSEFEEKIVGLHTKEMSSL
jgi:hypothetical protein